MHDGGVPAEAAEFRGVIRGCVETVGPRKGSFRVKITSATPDATSKAAKPQSLVSSVVLVIQGAEKSPEGKWAVKPGHHEWIAALQPGSLVVVPVRYTKSANGFRMNEVPPVPTAAEGCERPETAPAPVPASPAPAPPPPGSGAGGK